MCLNTYQYRVNHDMTFLVPGGNMSHVLLHSSVSTWPDQYPSWMSSTQYQTQFPWPSTTVPSPPCCSSAGRHLLTLTEPSTPSPELPPLLSTHKPPRQLITNTSHESPTTQTSILNQWKQRKWHCREYAKFHLKSRAANTVIAILTAKKSSYFRIYWCHPTSTECLECDISHAKCDQELSSQWSCRLYHTASTHTAEQTSWWNPGMGCRGAWWPSTDRQARTRWITPISSVRRRSTTPSSVVNGVWSNNALRTKNGRVGSSEANDDIRMCPETTHNDDRHHSLRGDLYTATFWS